MTTTSTASTALDFSDLDGIEDRVSNGGWVGDLPNMPAAMRLKVRALSNPDFQKLRASIDAKLKPGERRPDEDNALLLRKTILLNWDGLKTPYSEAAAAEALKRPTFQNAVFAAASVVAASGKASLEDLLGN